MIGGRPLSLLVLLGVRVVEVLPGMGNGTFGQVIATQLVDSVTAAAAGDWNG